MAISNQHTYNIAQVTGSWTSPAPMQVKFARLVQTADASAAAGLEVIAAVAGKKIRVLGLWLKAIGTTPSLTWISYLATGTVSTTIMGPYLAPVAAADGNAMVQSPFGLFETTVGEALRLKASNSDNDIHGTVVYCEVAPYTAV